MFRRLKRFLFAEPAPPPKHEQGRYRSRLQPNGNWRWFLSDVDGRLLCASPRSGYPTKDQCDAAFVTAMTYGRQPTVF